MSSTRSLLTFLADRRSYPHQPRSVRKVETHTAWVFLAGRLVFKIKKPVRLGFLDFSTLSKRARACDREVELNRRLCPDLYLGVDTVRLWKGRLTFGAAGRVVEYAVRMRRLDERFFMDRLLKRRRFRRPDLDRIASLLTEFYRRQSARPEIERWGRVDRLRLSTDENFRQIRPYRNFWVTKSVYEALVAYTNRFYRDEAQCLERRVRHHRPRDCHGDLRLEHIHITPRAIHIYDCVEFNDRLRYLDVANDLAFLAMDLDLCGRADLSDALTFRAADYLNDNGLHRVLDFYKCYRAIVRGKVECFQTRGFRERSRLGLEHGTRARRYFQLALRYALAGSEPAVIVVMGPVGSGKTTLARALAEALGWIHLSSDMVRKELAGLPLWTRAARSRRAGLYAPDMTHKTFEELWRRTRAALRGPGRGGVIVDATFGRPALRADWLRRLRGSGAVFLFVEAQAALSAVERRLRARSRGGPTREASDARWEDFKRLRAVYVPPTELPARHHVRIRTTGDPNEVLGRLLRMLCATNPLMRGCRSTGEGSRAEENAKSG